MILDEIDLEILCLLQTDAGLSQAELARRLALSQTACWRRVRRLEETGVIAKRVALIDPGSVGLTVNVMVAVSLTEHSDGTRAQMEALVDARPEIVECYSTTGERDYMLRVVVADIEGYYRFLTTHLLHHPVVSSASSSFVLRQIKYTTALPIARG